MRLVFPSYEYIFFFLPVVLAGYYAIRRFLPEKLHIPVPDELWLLAASLLFYLNFGAENFGILLVQAILGYVILTLLIRHRPVAGIRENTGFQDGIVLGVATTDSLRAAEKLTNGIYFGGAGLLLFLLGFYKYASPIMPIALSFTTFSLIELLAEAKDGDLEKVSPVDYLLFFFFFPKLLQGPIMHYTEFQASLTAARARTSASSEADASAPPRIPGFATALLYFVLGLAKKVLIADRLGAAVDLAYDAPGELLWMEALLTVICYSLQIYFDFSGYCDMGRAAAWMLGFDLPVNFDKPYRAAGIRDFWHRWHKSLTQFLTKRLYFPLGGSRCGLPRTLLNTLIVFLLSGLWHGEGLTFLIWGALHGAASCLERLCCRSGKADQTVPSDPAGSSASQRPESVSSQTDSLVARSSPVARRLLHAGRCTLTWCFVTFAWIFFRAPSISDAGVILDRIIEKPWFVLHDRFIDCFLVNELWYPLKVLGVPDARTGGIICLWLLISFAALAAFFLPSAEKISLGFERLLTPADAPADPPADAEPSAHKPHTAIILLTAILSAGLFLWCVFSLGEVASFLYFDF